MGIYNKLLRRFDGAFKYDVKLKENRRDSFCDLVYKGHAVLRINDVGTFCVLESYFIN